MKIWITRDNKISESKNYIFFWLEKPGYDTVSGEYFANDNAELLQEYTCRAFKKKYGFLPKFKDCLELDLTEYIKIYDFKNIYKHRKDKNYYENTNS